MYQLILFLNLINIQSMLDDLSADDNLNTSPAATSKVVPASVAPQLPPPPQGDAKAAEKYTKKLVSLIGQDKAIVHHTDLKKYDLASLQDHYRMNLGEYEVEVSHSKQPDSGKDFYVMLFNNLKLVQENGVSCTNKIILAYIHLSEEQFKTFKKSAEEQTERRRQKEDLKRFQQVTAPIDSLLENISAKPAPTEGEEKPSESNSSTQPREVGQNPQPQQSSSTTPSPMDKPTGNPWNNPSSGEAPLTN